MKILALEAANIKRIKAIEIIPQGNTVLLAGANKQGKTSILDAIWWALGGTANIQAQPIRKGETRAVIRLTLGDKDPELLVERTFTEKGEYIKVKNADGSTPPGGPEALLKKLVGHLAFDPVAFMREKPSDQLSTLRRLVPLLDDKGEPLNETVLNAQRQAAYTDRTGHNRDHAQAVARADGIVIPADLPENAPDVTALVQELSDVGRFNNEITTLQAAREAYDSETAQAEARTGALEKEAEELEQRLNLLKERLAEDRQIIVSRYDAAAARPPLPERKDPAEVEAQIAAARKIEEGINARRQKAELISEAATYKEQADDCTKTIEAIDKQKAAAVARAAMPVEGLAFGEGGVLFNTLPLDQASDAEQLQVSVAIAAAMNPKLRIMRVRDGSILDTAAFASLAQFAADKDYQIWIEVVDETGEVGVVIEDGGVRGQELTPEAVLGKDKAATAQPETAASAPQEAPSDERVAAADKFLTEALAELAAVTKTDPEGPQKIAALHGKVKAKLKNLPALIAEKWNPAKLEREAALKPKVVRE